MKLRHIASQLDATLVLPENLKPENENLKNYSFVTL
jgi:hypothetical protein